MTQPLHLIKATLRRDRALDAVKSLLEAEGPDDGAAKGHHLVWSLFAGRPDARRDFLWRRIDARSFLVLAQYRPPVAAHPFFDVVAKPFAPTLRVGDRLAFDLHANPVIRIRQDGRTTKVDVVMHALRRVREGDRGARRPEEIERQGLRWLAWQGERGGFAIEADAVAVGGYETMRIPRGPGPAGGRDDLRFSVMDVSGVLTVTEPERFAAALASGFGSAKAYGCGLMLIRRAAARLATRDEKAA